MVAIKFDVITPAGGVFNLKQFSRFALEHVMDEHMQKLMEDVSEYPPANSPTYVRTNVLFQAWRKTREVAGDVLTIIVSNEAFDKYGRMYTGFVHGDSQGLGQRALHASRGWLNLYQTHIQREPQLVDALQRTINRFL